MEPLVSVIVPVYNCEKYLENAIKCLLNQTLKECEYIIVNDGSTDLSKGIIDRYISLDSRIKVVDQNNQGVSIARNKGLELARGEYVSFIDADDWIELDMLEKLYNTAKAKKFDMVIINIEDELEGVKRVRDLGIPKNSILFKEDIKKIILPYLLEKEDLNSVCNKIFSNKIIKKYKLEFPKGVALGEDAAFNIKFFTYANSVYYLDYSGYHYREVHGSATRDTLKMDYFNMALQVYKNNIEETKLWGLDTNYIKKLKSIKLLDCVVSYTYMFFKQSNDKDLKKRYKYIHNMITNREVREALKISYKEVYLEKSRYEKFILKMIKYKCVFGIYLSVTYSRIRNENKKVKR